MAGGGRKPSIKVQVLAACLVSLFIKTASATSYIVGGDDYRWTTPTADPDIYAKWVHGKIFNVGDVLVFMYSRGHTVAEVSKAEFDHCTATNPISIATQGPVNVTINSPGDHFFICTFPGHCSFGQKLAITVLPAAAAAHPHPTLPHSAAPTTLPPAAAPTPSPATAPPLTTTPSAGEDIAADTPPPSPSPPTSAAVGVVAGLVITFSFAVAGFLLCL